MKLNTWECGVTAGLIATAAIIIISYPLAVFNVITLCDTEYAARFLMSIENQPMTPIHWLVGLLTNFSLGALFGMATTYFYQIFGFDSKLLKIIGIGIALWFFHLVIVPFLDPTVAKYSTPSVAISFFINYIIWSIIASLFIYKYLRRTGTT